MNLGSRTVVLAAAVILLTVWMSGILGELRPREPNGEGVAGVTAEVRKNALLSEIPTIPAGAVGGAEIGLPAGARPPDEGSVGAFAAAVAAAEETEAPILARVNVVRRAYGLRPLSFSAKLAASADAHAHSMATRGYFSHDWSNGAAFTTWVQRFYSPAGYGTWSAGENLLWASPPELTPHEVVRAWLNSPSHRRILLTPYWRELGIGVVHARRAPGVYQRRDVAVIAANFGLRS